MPKINKDWDVAPHGPLTEIEDGILAVEGQIVMPLGKFPRRMTVVRLSGGRTAIWSAIALEEPGMARIEALGTPSFLIVPSDHHRLDAPAWKNRYPDIAVVTPPGARAKVTEVVPVDATDDILDDTDTRFTIVAGTGQHEAALLVRRPAGLTLVTNDVIGNVRHPEGIGANIMARLMGFGVHHPEVPRGVQHMIIEDKTALAGQFRTWAREPDLKRLIVSHGDPIEQPRAALLALADSLSS